MTIYEEGTYSLPVGINRIKVVSRSRETHYIDASGNFTIKHGWYNSGHDRTVHSFFIGYVEVSRWSGGNQVDPVTVYWGPDINKK